MFRKKHSFIVAVVTVVSFKVLTFLYGIEQVSIECFTSLCDWFRKLAPLSQPIRCKNETNLDLVARVFPRFRQFGFCFEFSLALKGIFLSSYWLLWLFRFGFTTLNRKALCFQFSEIVVNFSWIWVTVFSLWIFFFSHICPLLPFLRQPGKCFAASSAKLDELASFFSICRQFETIFSMRQAILECYWRENFLSTETSLCK